MKGKLIMTVEQAAAATAASLDLPINPSLGKAWIVPYKGCVLPIRLQGRD